ncbi:hypothetical protein ACHAW6_002100, partial [Cyclotella cf. meneghiniana]
IPQQDGRVRWISALCQVNKVIKCRQYNLLIILDILQKCSGNKFSTNLTLVCNTIPLSLMKPVRISVQLLLFLASVNTQDS